MPLTCPQYCCAAKGGHGTIGILGSIINENMLAHRTPTRLKHWDSRANLETHAVFSPSLLWLVCNSIIPTARLMRRGLIVTRREATPVAWGNNAVIRQGNMQMSHAKWKITVSWRKIRLFAHKWIVIWNGIYFNVLICYKPNRVQWMQRVIAFVVSRMVLSWI